MNSIIKFLGATLFVLSMGVSLIPVANAHMMVAQHGSLNVTQDGTYMILSLPVSAFQGIDDNADGRLSMEEFKLYRKDIVDAVGKNITLSDDKGSLELQGIMLSPVEMHDDSNGPASQLIVLGRFSLRDIGSPLHFQVSLFGETPTEKRLAITATRKFDGKKHVFELTPTTSAGILFPLEEYVSD